jgi:hypothetical protein
MSSLTLPLVSPPASSSDVAGSPISLPPWFTPPTGSIWFDAVGLAAIPALGQPAATVVSQTIPTGYSGLVWMLANVAQYGGFTDGLGWLIWQILNGSNAVQNYQNVIAQLGALDAPQRTFIEVPGGNTVSWTVQSAVQAPPSGAQTLCRLTGWYWPTTMT